MPHPNRYPSDKSALVVDVFATDGRRSELEGSASGLGVPGVPTGANRAQPEGSATVLGVPEDKFTDLGVPIVARACVGIELERRSRGELEPFGVPDLVTMASMVHCRSSQQSCGQMLSMSKEQR